MKMRRKLLEARRKHYVPASRCTITARALVIIFQILYMMNIFYDLRFWHDLFYCTVVPKNSKSRCMENFSVELKSIEVQQEYLSFRDYSQNLTNLLLKERIILRNTRRLMEVNRTKGEIFQVSDSTQAKFQANNKLLVLRAYGNAHAYAYYYADIFVGNPGQVQSVIVDTGSSLLGFPCSACVYCGTSHKDKFFDVDASNSAKWLSCKDYRCKTGRCSASSTDFLPKQICSYSQHYSEGSMVEGMFFSDKIELLDKNSHDENTSFEYDHIGCHKRETLLFHTQKANGIMGLAESPLSPEQFIVAKMKASGLIKKKIFSICFSINGGEIIFGGYKTDRHIAIEALDTNISLPNALFSKERDRDNHVKNVLDRVARRILRNSRLHNNSEKAYEPRKYSEYRFSSNAVWYIDSKGKLLKTNNKEKSPKTSGKAGIQANSRQMKADVLSFLDNHLSLEGRIKLDSDKSLQTNHSAIVWTPLISTYKYEVQVTKVYGLLPSVFDDRIYTIGESEELGPSIIDSGTTFSYFPSTVFQRISQLFDKFCNLVIPCKILVDASDINRCWELTDINSQKLYFPILALRFSDNDVIYWYPESYLQIHSANQPDVWCLAINANDHKQTVLGISFMLYHDIIYDKEANRIGNVSAIRGSTFINIQFPALDTI